jgi:hypothetical protein
MTGGAIRVCFQPRLSVCSGKLVTAEHGVGTAVYAACFIRKREIMLESALVRRPAMFRLILIHELFHFVWTRLGNGMRREFADLAAGEYKQHARGELGESADVQKALLKRSDVVTASRAGGVTYAKVFATLRPGSTPA